MDLHCRSRYRKGTDEMWLVHLYTSKTLFRSSAPPTLSNLEIVSCNTRRLFHFKNSVLFRLSLHFGFSFFWTTLKTWCNSSYYSNFVMGRLQSNANFTKQFEMLWDTFVRHNATCTTKCRILKLNTVNLSNCKDSWDFNFLVLSVKLQLRFPFCGRQPYTDAEKNSFNFLFWACLRPAFFLPILVGFSSIISMGMLENVNVTVPVPC